MLLRRFNKSCLRVTGLNATEAERPFYERSRMLLHVTTALAVSFSVILSCEISYLGQQLSV